MVEHFANRSVTPCVWDDLIIAAEVDPTELQVARAVVAEFWLALTIRRNHRGMIMRPAVTPSEQLDRVKTLRT